MAVLAGKQQFGERDALPGRPQARHAQHRRQAWPAGRHGAGNKATVGHRVLDLR
jgi:hypothetical protein